MLSKGEQDDGREKRRDDDQTEAADADAVVGQAVPAFALALDLRGGLPGQTERDTRIFSHAHEEGPESYQPDEHDHHQQAPPGVTLQPPHQAPRKTQWIVTHTSARARREWFRLLRRHYS